MNVSSKTADKRLLVKVVKAVGLGNKQGWYLNFINLVT